MSTLRGYTVRTDITFVKHDNVAAHDEAEALKIASESVDRWIADSDLQFDCPECKSSIEQSYDLW